MSNKKVGVYLLHNPVTDQSYIGSSGDLDERKNSHFRLLKENKHFNRRLQSAFNQNPNFEFVSVPSDDREEAFDLEQTIINEYWGNPLFLNMCTDSRRYSREWTEMQRIEHGEKMRKAVKNYYDSLSEEERRARIEITQKTHQGNTYRLGAEHRSESKEKMSQVRKELWEALPEEERRNRTAAATNARIGVAVNSKKILAEGQVFESQREAARAFGIGESTVNQRVNNPAPQWDNWKRL